MSDFDKAPRFDHPENITVGKARVIYALAVIGFSKVIYPEGWVLPGGRRKQDKIEAYRAPGRPAGPVRMALLAALRAGVVGTFDAMARHAGVPPEKARITLDSLRREGVACSWQADIAGCLAKRRVGRPPVVYGPPVVDCGPLDALAFVRQAWR